MTAEFVGFQNSAELYSALEQLPAKVQRKNLLDPFKEAVKIWEEEAKRRAPVETGELRASIKAVRGRMRNGRVGAAVVIKPTSGTSTDGAAKLSIKANAQEFGWNNERQHPKTHRRSVLSNLQRHHPGHPFMRPAFEAKKEDVVKYIENAMNEIVAQAWEDKK